MPFKSCDDPDCRKTFNVDLDNTSQKYCSEKCKKKMIKGKSISSFTSLSIERNLKNRLDSIQIGITKEIQKHIPYSKVIEVLLEIAGKYNNGNVIQAIVDNIKGGDKSE